MVGGGKGGMRGLPPRKKERYDAFKETNRSSGRKKKTHNRKGGRREGGKKGMQVCSSLKKKSRSTWGAEMEKNYHQQGGLFGSASLCEKRHPSK